jgi:hypothetical protein
MLTMTVIVALGRLIGLNVTVQITAGGLVTLLTLAYVVTTCQPYHSVPFKKVEAQ